MAYTEGAGYSPGTAQKSGVGMFGKSLLIGGGLLNAYANYQAGLAEKDAHYSNAAALEREAKYREERGKFDEEQARKAGEQYLGTMLASSGAFGVDVSQGSPLEMLVAQHAQNTLEQETIRHNAEVEASMMRQQAAAEREAAKAAEKAGKYGAVGSLLQTAATLALL